MEREIFCERNVIGNDIGYVPES